MEPAGASPVASRACQAYQGRLDEAERDLARALELCEDPALLESRIAVGRYGSEIALALGDAGLARERSVEFLRLAERFGATGYVAGAREVLGRTLLLEGRASEAVTELEGAAELFEASPVSGSHYLISAHAFLARAQADANRAELALEVATEALHLAVAHPTAVLSGIEAELSMAHVLIVLDPAGKAEEIESRLARAAVRERELGTRHFVPCVHLERAQLAAARGDDAACRLERERARDEFAAIGASGHVERISTES